MSGRSKKAEVNISTVGVDVCDWIYPKKTDFAFGRADNRTSIKFSTWDFGGQVRLRRGGNGRGGLGDSREVSQASHYQFGFGEMVTLPRERKDVVGNFGRVPNKMKTGDYRVKNRVGCSQRATV